MICITTTGSTAHCKMIGTLNVLQVFNDQHHHHCQPIAKCWWGYWALYKYSVIHWFSSSLPNDKDTECSINVPTSSPSHGRDVTVYVLDINHLSLPTLFIPFLCLFLSLWPFHLYFIPQILPTTLGFLTLFLWSHFCLIGPFNYISLYICLPQPWCNPLWLTGLATTN